MSGFLSISKKNSLQTILKSHQFQILLASMSVGVISGVFIACVKLHLGMPGHKAFFWMTPVLIARLRGGCKIGTTAGGLSAALTVFFLGENLAGGVIAMPLILAAGGFLDWAVYFFEKNKISGLSMILGLALAATFANLICLAKRLFLPAGISPHYLLGLSGFPLKLCSYAFFGFISGLTAAIASRPKKIPKTA